MMPWTSLSEGLFTVRYIKGHNQGPCQCSGQILLGPFEHFYVPFPSFGVYLFPEAHT